MKVVIRKLSSLLVGVVALSSLFVFNSSSVQAQTWPDPGYSYVGGWIKAAREVPKEAKKPDGTVVKYKCLEITLATNATGTQTETIFICDSNCPIPECCQVCAACYPNCMSKVEAHARSSAKERVIFVTLTAADGSLYAQGLPAGYTPDGTALNCHCFLDIAFAFAGN